MIDANDCTPEAVMPLHNPNTSGQIFEMDEEEFLTGVIVSPDLIVEEIDQKNEPQ